ncbi:MAG: hypothetical protein ACKVQJ_02025 [Pyrinomonadaceae bacterium]
MKLIFAAIFSFALAFTAFAQSPSKILKQAEKALGGTNAIKSVKSLARAGHVKRVSDGTEGKYLIQTSQPNLLNIAFDLDGFETETGFNGRSGWMRDSRNGLQTLTGAESVALQAKAAFRNNLWLNAKSDKSRIVSGGQSSIDGKPVNLVIITTPKGVVIKVYFDAVTGLPLRDEIPSGTGTETTDYSDYRVVNGVKRPFKERVSVGDQVYEIRYEDVQANQQIASSEFDFPNLSGQPLPDIPVLLKDLQANEDRVDAMLDSYSYTQKVIKRELRKDGILRETESETTQLSFYKGYRIERVIEKNGRPLSPNDQVRADKDAAKQVEEIEKKIAKNDARVAKKSLTGTPSNDNRRISIAEILRASKLLNPRRERFRGRDCVVFDFEPNPAFDMKNAQSMLKFFGKTAGVMWIDEKDKQVARVEAVLYENINIGGGFLAKLNKGATFTLEKERVGDEIWLPSQADINLSVRVLLVKGIDINQVIKSYDYRKFETEVKDAKVDETKKP